MYVIFRGSELNGRSLVELLRVVPKKILKSQVILTQELIFALSSNLKRIGTKVVNMCSL